MLVQCPRTCKLGKTTTDASLMYLPTKRSVMSAVKMFWCRALRRDPWRSIVT